MLRVKQNSSDRLNLRLSNDEVSQHDKNTAKKKNVQLSEEFFLLKLEEHNLKEIFLWNLIVILELSTTLSSYH